MNDKNWIVDVLLDVARFTEENEFPKTCEILIEAVKVAAIEGRSNNVPIQYAESNVVPLFERELVRFAIT